ncbi:kelch repeat protein [Ilyonectria robusta]
MELNGGCEATEAAAPISADSVGIIIQQGRSTRTASWVRLASSARLQRSSQILSISGSNAWIFGGELLPRQPVDSQLDIIELGNASSKHS